MQARIYFLTVVLSVLFCGILSSQEQADSSIRFPKSIPADKAAMIIERIHAFSDAILADNYSALVALWYDSFHNIGFSGDFLLQLENYKENQEDEYRRGNLEIELCHCVDAKTNKEKYQLKYPGAYNRIGFDLAEGKKIVAYAELGIVIQEIMSFSFSEKTGLADSFSYVFRQRRQKEEARNDEVIPDEAVSIDWKTGKAVIDGDMNTLSKMPMFPHPNKVFKKKETEKEPTIQWSKVMQLPKNEDESLQRFFDRVRRMSSVRKFGDFTDLLESLQKTPQTQIILTFSFAKWRCLWIHAQQNISDNKKTCYALTMNQNGSPKLYLEGDVIIPEEFENMPTLADLSRGIEVRFHDNGYPKSYRSLVRGRLYGRQIEWNDRGRVTSDVDIDIPKEIKDKK